MMRTLGTAGRLRRGFTLLEVLLASAIAVLLMAGLYVAMEVQIRLTHEAREIVDQSTLSRSLIHRLTTDLTPSLSPVLGRTQFSGSGAGATAGSSSDSTGTGTTGSATQGGSSGGGSGMSGASGSSGSSSSSQSTDTTSPAVPFQAGVVGTSQQLTIYVTRLPGQVGTPSGQSSAISGGDSAATPSDLRRISYWIASAGGLARQETPWLTDPNVINSTDPDVSNEAQSVIAEEVTDVLFEYWDGSAWQSTWDGTQLSSDQQTPIGPPMAIAVTLTVKGAKGAADRSYRHVIAIPTAPSPLSSTANSTTTNSGAMNSP